MVGRLQETECSEPGMGRPRGRGERAGTEEIRRAVAGKSNPRPRHMGASAGRLAKPQPGERGEQIEANPCHITNEISVRYDLDLR